MPRSNKKKRGNQIVLRLGDGVHLHLETTKQNKKKSKKRGVEVPFLSRLGDGTHLCSKEKNQNKKKEGEFKLPVATPL